MQLNEVSGTALALAPRMFAFFSNRLGCLGSIVVSVIGTAILALLMVVARRGDNWSQFVEAIQ